MHARCWLEITTFLLLLQLIDQGQVACKLPPPGARQCCNMSDSPIHSHWNYTQPQTHQVVGNLMTEMQANADEFTSAHRTMVNVLRRTWCSCMRGICNLHACLTCSLLLGGILQSLCLVAFYYQLQSHHSQSPPCCPSTYNVSKLQMSQPAIDHQRQSAFSIQQSHWADLNNRKLNNTVQSADDRCVCTFIVTHFHLFEH